MRTIAYAEIEAFAVECLLARMEGGQLDAGPIWTDLRTFPWAEFRDQVDILSGGYPCQPFSAAGKRQGADDPRHLWPFISAGIAAMRPSICFFENVEGHISLGLPDVIEDLAGLGYRTTWGIFSAAEVGAPHQRKRVFILAHRIGTGLEGFARYGIGGNEPGRQSPQPCRPVGAGSGELADTANAGHREDTRGLCSGEAEAWCCTASESDYCGATAWPARPGEQQHGWEPPRVLVNGNGFNGRTPAEGRQHDSETGPTGWRQAQPSLGRDIDGPAGGLGYAELCVTYQSRCDELRLLGNGVVPATAERAFRVLINELLTTNQQQ
jgi:DNA (cytosine-5)-methyltransferase 1